MRHNICWRWKAYRKSRENKKLKKRIRRLEKSRDSWKAKAHKANEELKKKLLKQLGEVNPKKYAFKLNIIQLLLQQKLWTSASFRAVSKMFSVTNLLLKIACNNPTHTTIINWVHKIGYYQLSRKKEKEDDWIIVLDHSIQLGKDKVFVILGIREKNIDFSKPLQFQDLLPLREISKDKWNGDLVKETLSELKEEIGQIKYAVGDYGSDIKKGLKLAEIPHIHDITHKIALILEKLYEEDKQFKKLTVGMSAMRNKFSQSGIAHIIPPSQRSKSRYQNINIISDWCMKAIISIEDKKTDNAIKKRLKWLKRYKDFIEELSNLNHVICAIEKIVKSFGVSKSTVKECVKLMGSIKGEKSLIFKDELIKYFEETMTLLPQTENILCTSDILESAFGKYKNYVSKNPMAGITNLVLAIAAFTSKLEQKEIKDALEKVKTANVKEWTKKFIGKTLLQKRREFFAAA